MCLAKIPARVPPRRRLESLTPFAGCTPSSKTHGQKPTDQVPEILEAMTKGLVANDPTLASVIVTHTQFGHPGHVLFANALPAESRSFAVRGIVKSITKLDEDAARAAWSPSTGASCGELQPGGVADRAALGRRPAIVRRDRLDFDHAPPIGGSQPIRGRINSTQAKVVKAAADSLAVVAQKAGPRRLAEPCERYVGF